eukprot:g18715.t1
MGRQTELFLDSFGESAVDGPRERSSRSRALTVAEQAKLSLEALEAQAWKRTGLCRHSEEVFGATAAARSTSQFGSALGGCQTRHVLRSIAPMISFSNPQVYERFSGVAKVLSSWKFMKIDFAIIGTGGCGTTSLRRNLAQHAEVRFTNENEDELFAPGYAYEYQGGFRLLPTEAQVNMVRCGRARCHGERKEREHWVAARRLLIVSSLFDTRDVMVGPSCGWIGGASADPARVSRAPVQGLVPSHWASRAAGHTTLGRRGTGYSALVASRSSGYHRYNSFGGRRTGLCQRKNLLKEFQEALEPEYPPPQEVLRQLGHPEISELSRRTTRCHRHAELRRAARCVNQRCDL